MSIWTPDGEHSVPRQGQDQTTSPTPDSATASSEPTMDSPAEAPELTPEQQEQARAMAHELAEARARLLEAPASTVIINHALGIYELAAIHLTAEQPKLDEAQLAIDALASLVEGLQGRLGPEEPNLVEALHHVRLAFVSQSESTAAPAAGD